MTNPKTHENMNLPCGKCLPCRKRRTSGWSFRLRNEDRHSLSSYFLTLTYNTDHVPITPNGYMTYSLSHFQTFVKKLRQYELRKQANQATLKYYAVTEYGTEKYRPHFHVILFNATLASLIGSVNANHVAAKRIMLDGKHEFHSPLWPYGHITIGQVSAASIGYVLEYISKQARIPVHKNDDRLKERSVMSKGLGEKYLKTGRQWHRKNLLNRYYLPIEDGKRIALPRYYKDRLYSKTERIYIGKQKQIIPLEMTEKERLLQIEANEIKMNRPKKSKL